MPPPPAPVNNIDVSHDNDALASMLMAWYLSGYHTGYFQVSDLEIPDITLKYVGNVIVSEGKSQLQTERLPTLPIYTIFSVSLIFGCAVIQV